MTIKKDVVLDMCDAFVIQIVKFDGSMLEYCINQEDARRDLVDVFAELGFTTEYEEVY